MPSTTLREKEGRPAPTEAPRQQSIEERTAYLEDRLKNAPAREPGQVPGDLDMSWIAHDSALEGVVYTLRRAACGHRRERRQHRVRLEHAAGGRGDPPAPRGAQLRSASTRIKRRQPLTVDVVKRIYCVLHPEEGDIKTVKYRKDIPQHRLYFHEYAPPDKIAYKLRQIVDWVNDPETRRTRTPVRLAARAHYDLLRVFPFTTDSGKVARLVMNLLLLRSGYPPAIIHSTERQRYYEALKGSSTTMHGIVQDAIENSLSSIEKLLDHYEPKPNADRVRACESAACFTNGPRRVSLSTQRCSRSG